MPERPLVITLTTIPPRFANLGRKFKAISRQTRRPDRVELNIPKSYRRFIGEVPSLPPLPDWVSVKSCEFDFGPATKLLPTVQRWRGTPADLLVCDDDRLPDPHWLERFATSRKVRPDDIITERGWNIAERFGIERSAAETPRAKFAPKQGRTFGYRIKRILSLNCAHPPRKLFENPGYIDVFEGFLGALIPSVSIPNAAFDIPEVIWTVDDVWLSGMAYLNGTRVWAHDIPRPVFADGYFDRIESLRDFVEEGHGRTDADRIAVEYLRRVHKVWP